MALITDQPSPFQSRPIGAGHSIFTFPDSDAPAREFPDSITRAPRRARHMALETITILSDDPLVGQTVPEVAVTPPLLRHVR